jgi:carbon storage regulator
MLVLGRDVGESVFIGDVEVVVLKHNGKKMRLGIRAPKDVKILRAELVANPASTEKADDSK